jgi:antitoxin component YwqK of YwqJK toxin-antitoxin module
MKYLVLSFMMLLGAVGVKAQDVAYLNSQLQEVKKREAEFVRELTQFAPDKFSARVVDMKGKVKFEGIYTVVEGKMYEHGEFIFYHPNGKVESRGFYEYGVKTGTWERYDAVGSKKADKYYNPESAALIRSTMKKQ